MPITITLVGTGVVTGRLTFVNGTPAANASIEIFGNNVPFESATTDSNGIYTITQVPVGRPFTVRAFDPRGFNSFRDVLNNVLVNNGDTLNINLVLPALATVQVTVLQANGTPLAGAQIDVKNSINNFFQFAGVTNTSGVLSILMFRKANLWWKPSLPITLVSPATLPEQSRLPTMAVR